MSWMSHNEIESMGFASVGENVLLSNKASYYNCKNISIGNNVRIDDFCVLSAGVGGIQIGNYIHIAVYTSIIGDGEVRLADFCNLSSRVSVYSSNDDYSGHFMTNPMVPHDRTNVKCGDIFIGRHVIIGSGSVLLPGITLEEGVAVGALSLVASNCKEFGVYGGIPAVRIKERSHDLLMFETGLLK